LSKLDFNDDRGSKEAKRDAGGASTERPQQTADAVRPVQFSLRSILVLTAGVGLLLGIAKWAGVSGVGIGLIAWGGLGMLLIFLGSAWYRLSWVFGGMVVIWTTPLVLWALTVLAP